MNIYLNNDLSLEFSVVSDSGSVLVVMTRDEDDSVDEV